MYSPPPHPNPYSLPTPLTPPCPPRLSTPQIETVGFKHTGRFCVAPGCGGALQDNTLDWESKLPDDELQVAVDKADEAVGEGKGGGQEALVMCGGERGWCVDDQEGGGEQELLQENTLDWE